MDADEIFRKLREAMIRAQVWGPTSHRVPIHIPTHSYAVTGCAHPEPSKPKPKPVEPWYPPPGTPPPLLMTTHDPSFGGPV